jgi:His-Xaa-Ser system radical SAM maturase HxsB
MDQELFADLISNFFISEKPIPNLIDVLATRYRTKKSFLDHFTALHIFVITLRCDHSCQYCQVTRVNKDQITFDMSKEHLDLGIKMMMMSPNPHVTMEFQGGECLLAFPMIKYAIEKSEVLAKTLNKKITFVFCTNLSPLNEENLLFCKEHEVLISTSLDGPENVHNFNRRKDGNNSYEVTIKGINRCRESLGSDKVSALMTTSPYSLKYPVEIIEEYYNQGFRNIFLRAISPYGYASKNQLKDRFEVEEFLKFYKTAFERILRYNLDGEYFVEDYARIILKKILTPFPVNFVDLNSPAGVINNVVVFNYDGKVYASDESRMLAEMGDLTFQLGDLSKNSYEEIFYGDRALDIAQNWSLESLAGCSECAFQVYCGADPVRYHATQGDMYGYRPSSAHCIKNMEIIRYLIELMDSNKEIEKIFRRWAAN